MKIIKVPGNNIILIFREDIESKWRETRRNIITDYKRKSKQALQRNQKR